MNNFLSNKKILLFVGIGAVIIALGVGGYFYYQSTQKPQASNNTQQQFFIRSGTGRGGFRNTTGKIVSIDGANLIVDNGTAQVSVQTNADTTIRKLTTTPKTGVLVANAQITAQYTVESTGNVATTIIKGDLGMGTAGARPSGVPSGAPSGTPPTGGQRYYYNGGGTESGGLGRTGTYQGPQNRTRFVIGTIVSFTDTSVVIKQQNGDQSNLTLDITNAKFVTVATAKVSDLTINQQVQITGSVGSDTTTVAARSIIIE